MNFHLGEGSFVKDFKFGDIANDPFAFKKGLANLFKDEVVLNPGEPNKEVFSNGFQDAKPKIEKDFGDNKDLDEYGYGFWARFLTAYPQQLISGKN